MSDIVVPDVSSGFIRIHVSHSLERSGLLTHRERLIEGRLRTHHAITDAGRQALADPRPRLRELVAEVLGPDTER